jgi:hypothetical protein
MLHRWTVVLRCALIAPIGFFPFLPGPARAQGRLGLPTVHNIREIGKVLTACMRPLTIPNPYPGMRITVRLGFNRRGELLGPPRFTYMTPNAPDRIKTEYKSVISDTLRRCTPLSFSSEFGATIAGEPVILRFDERGSMQARLGEPSVYTPPVPPPSSPIPPTPII